MLLFAVTVDIGISDQGRSRQQQQKQGREGEPEQGEEGKCFEL